jgi:hypothetical protein
LQRQSVNPKEQALDDESRPASPEKGGQMLNASAAPVSITVVAPFIFLFCKSDAYLLHHTQSLPSLQGARKSNRQAGVAAPLPIAAGAHRGQTAAASKQQVGDKTLLLGMPTCAVLRISVIVAGAWKVLLQFVLHSCFSMLTVIALVFLIISIIIYYYLDKMVHI